VQHNVCFKSVCLLAHRDSSAHRGHHHLRSAHLKGNRPMAEVLTPKRKSISDEFLRGFQGMTAEPFSLEELTGAREELIDTAVGKMPQPHRRFLISFERGEPHWQLLQVPAARDLPAIRWRQQILERMPSAEHAQLVSRLEAVLFNLVN
jgi:hypothetical protein